jgi:hypothetical protein
MIQRGRKGEQRKIALPPQRLRTNNAIRTGREQPFFLQRQINIIPIVVGMYTLVAVQRWYWQKR